MYMPCLRAGSSCRARLLRRAALYKSFGRESQSSRPLFFFLAHPCTLTALRSPRVRLPQAGHSSQGSLATSHGFPIAADGNTNATGKYDSTAAPLYVAGANVHPLTARVAAADSTPTLLNTLTPPRLP